MLIVGVSALAVGVWSCGGGKRIRRPKAVSNGPARTPPPSCVHGALVTSRRVCGLGIAGPAFYWKDEKMRELAKRRAARNLAGMMQTIVNSAMQMQESTRRSSIRWEQFLEVDDSQIDRIQENAEHELWYDVRGEGPFRDPKRTYDCACMSAAELGIRVDTRQAEQHAIARQYSVDEVPEWLANPKTHNNSLFCAVGSHERMYHPEEMYEPLADSVRIQLMGETRTWILSQLSEETLCRGGSEAQCRTVVDSVVEAANEGVSRGVLLTAVWLDTNGIGPRKTKRTAYGWGCVFDKPVLERARERLASLRAISAKPALSDDASVGE